MNNSDWDRYAIAGYYRLAECEPEQQQHQATGMALDNGMHVSLFIDYLLVNRSYVCVVGL
jgi:hypothetical protein